MTNEQIIESAVNDFVTKTESFTSVDVANSIKRSGTWVRNRDVAAWLRANFRSPNYKKSRISVDGNGTTAMLYHPDYYDPSVYTGSGQSAITPDEFKQLHPTAVIPVPDVPLVDDDDKAPDAVPSTGNNEAEIKISSGGRIWIPGFLTQKLGWKAGDLADCSKIADISGTPKLKVHLDGRVSVSIKRLNSQQYAIGQIVKISFEGGQIKIRPSA